MRQETIPLFISTSIIDSDEIFKRAIYDGGYGSDISKVISHRTVKSQNYDIKGTKESGYTVTIKDYVGVDPASLDIAATYHKAEQVIKITVQRKESGSPQVYQLSTIGTHIDYSNISYQFIYGLLQINIPMKKTETENVIKLTLKQL